MSAVDEYRKSVEFADRFDPMEALEKADAAIAELEAELAFVKDWLDDIEPVQLVRCEMRWAERKVEL